MSEAEGITPLTPAEAAQMAVEAGEKAARAAEVLGADVTQAIMGAHVPQVVSPTVEERRGAKSGNSNTVVRILIARQLAARGIGRHLR